MKNFMKNLTNHVRQLIELLFEEFKFWNHDVETSLIDVRFNLNERQINEKCKNYTTNDIQAAKRWWMSVIKLSMWLSMWKF